MSEDLKAPFPAFGGKGRAAALVWERFGTVVNYVEPFLFSAAVLLACPEDQRPRVETANDLNGFVSNFWRAIRADSEAVAREADYPVIETDLHARHRWLLARAKDLRERLDADPDYYDVKVAAWWVWGASAWIGSGWCESEKHRIRCQNQPPLLGAKGEGGACGTGIHATGMHKPSRQLPDLSTRQVGEGGGHKIGFGIHAASMREPSRQLPHLGGGDGSGHARVGFGVNSSTVRTRLHDLFAALSRRLRHTRIACGDWSRICTPAVTYRHGLTAVFLDPPYEGHEHLYGHKKGKGEDALSARVRAWAIEQGERKDMRIALCGYEGEHDMPATWECVAWKAKGGYGNQRSEGDNENAARERIYFSPACLRPGRDVGQLVFAGAR